MKSSLFILDLNLLYFPRLGLKSWSECSKDITLSFSVSLSASVPEWRRADLLVEWSKTNNDDGATYNAWGRFFY